ncbi:MAG: DnaJ domain-containing protein [Deltaproteobacteria bacterium]|nr:DnaJ domain-containing protein [Deltaproteobacteria bacterium]
MKPTILLVERDRPTRKLLTGILESEGFSVSLEVDSRDASRIFASQPFQAVLVGDIGCGDPIALIETIRGSPQGELIPIFLVDHQQRPEALRSRLVDQLQLSGWLERPIRSEQLLEPLRQQVLPHPGTLADPDSRREQQEVEQGARHFTGAIQGSLDTKPFPELLVEMQRMAADGTLLLKSGRHKKMITLREGYPIAIKSNRLSECLGRILVRAQLISEQDCERSLERMRSSGHRQGTVLLDMGCISPQSLKKALQMQHQLKLFDLFGWQTGEYRFKPEDAPSDEAVPLRSSTAALVLKGIKKRLRGERIEPWLADRLDRYMLPNPDPVLRFQDMGLDEWEDLQLSALDGRCTLAEFLNRGSDRERMAQLAYALTCTGMVVLSEHPSEPLDPDLDDEPEPAPSSRTVLPPPPIQEMPSFDDVPDMSEDQAPQGPSTGLTQVRERLALQIQDWQAKDYYEILGVDRDASRTQIRKAFFSMAKQYHPDRNKHSDSTQVRALAVELFQGICKAQEVLLDEKRRAAYTHEIEQHPADACESPIALPGTAERSSQALEAELLFREGRQAIGREEYHLAKERLAQAVELCPDEGEYLAEWGLAALRAEPSNPAVLSAVESQLGCAASLSPNLDTPHLYLGYCHLAAGKADSAIEEFEKALARNPYCFEALQELRKL